MRRAIHIGWGQWAIPSAQAYDYDMAAATDEMDECVYKVAQLGGLCVWACQVDKGRLARTAAQH